MSSNEHSCPICAAHTSLEHADFPFCSMRCKQVDLLHWFNGAYRIPGDAAEDAELAYEEFDPHRLPEKDEELLLDWAT